MSAVLGEVLLDTGDDVSSPTWKMSEVFGDGLEDSRRVEGFLRERGLVRLGGGEGKNVAPGSRDAPERTPTVGVGSQQLEMSELTGISLTLFLNKAWDKVREMGLQSAVAELYSDEEEEVVDE
ncbi:hypothetical protein T484DRAFT_1884849 [Baffinella frigidus]|nr:hypothetical protein T484DRAFT_1884849 [Cryptophyta sp. CCMP2293]